MKLVGVINEEGGGRGLFGVGCGVWERSSRGDDGVGLAMAESWVHVWGCGRGGGLTWFDPRFITKGVVWIGLGYGLRGLGWTGF